jgi:phosphopantothenoylcysteine decarboxylase / phosphopantothenate---cysteine ligase
VTLPLADTRILLGVTGGIAAYKAALLARLLVGAGAAVDPVMTAGAERFLGAATLEGITGHRVRADVWDDIPAETHVALGRGAEVAVIYPATAHTLAKLAHGLADDLLTTTLLAATCPLLVCPAMHTEMWQHPATQANVALLRERGVQVLGPADGPLMGGDAGPGRVVEPQEAYEAVLAARGRAPGSERDLAGVRVVVTAGGTREMIDPVRFLGNRSSGRMGFALAADAAARGAEVTLIAAPSDLPTPDDVERVDVTSAQQMHEAVFAVADHADVIIKAAAVADFRPATTASSKLKKAGGIPPIELVANPDILAELGARRNGATRPVLVGFAAETDDVETNGRAKLAAKGADLLVVNDVSTPDAGFEVDTNRVVILGADDSRTEVALATKQVVAQRILDVVAARLTRERTDRVPGHR